MERRDFLWTMAGAAVANYLPETGIAAAQPGNPKVYLFGLTIIDDQSKAVRAIFPRLDASVQHRPFLVGNTDQIAALKGTAVLLKDSGLDQVHPDFSYDRWPAAWCFDDVALAVGSNGAGPVTIQEKLRSVLPSLTTLGTLNEKPQLKLPKGTSVVTLAGGTLRLPGTGSSSLGTKPGVEWEIWNGGTKLAGPMGIADMAVFESATPTLDVSTGGGKLTMNAGDVIWLFNLPLAVPEDDEAKVIEHAGDPFSLLSINYPGEAVRGTTSYPLTFRKPEDRKIFTHPCCRSKAACDAAERYISKRHDRKRARHYVPPDSDPCFMWLV